MHNRTGESDHTDLVRAAEIVRNARRMVVFSGAGISAESGIPTFRDADGLWSEFPPEQYGHLPGLAQAAMHEPRRVVDFLLAVLEPIAAAEPNAGHCAIAELAQRVPSSVITQNVDGLHQDAGSETVHEVHGSLLSIVDCRGEPIRQLARGDLRAVVTAMQQARDRSLALPRALISLRKLIGVDLRGMHRPNIVLFGEAMAEPAWSHAVDAASACDVMLVVGTSAEVYPAATLPEHASASGAEVISVDPNPVRGDLRLRGTAGSILPQLVRLAFQGEN